MAQLTVSRKATNFRHIITAFDKMISQIAIKVNTSSYNITANENIRKMKVSNLQIATKMCGKLQNITQWPVENSVEIVENLAKPRFL